MATGDEGRHRPGPEPDWQEAWSFDWATPDGALGGFVRVGLSPHRGVAWYWAGLVGEGRPVVAVVDHEVPLPRAGLEVRTEGLWAAHNLETALDHWSLGCEAFAVAADDPDEVHDDLRGDRVPLGLDLEWETDGDVVAGPGGGRYDVPCRVTGEVLVGPERIEVDGPGWRDHSWGPAAWWTAGWQRGWLALDGGAPRPIGPDGPGRAKDPTVAPVAAVPLRLDSPDGRRARLTRTLVRVSTAEGPAGVGWAERNQPSP